MSKNCLQNIGKLIHGISNHDINQLAPTSSGRNLTTPFQNLKCFRTPPDQIRISSIDLSLEFILRTIRPRKAHYENTDQLELRSYVSPYTLSLRCHEYEDLIQLIDLQRQLGSCHSISRMSVIINTARPFMCFIYPSN